MPEAGLCQRRSVFPTAFLLIALTDLQLLVVEDDKRKATKTIILRESWFDTPATPGSYVHVIGEFDSGGLCQIDNTNNMLILHPDHLISATVVADSFGCIRRAVLQDRIKATSEATAPQLYGHMLHELFQEAMKANRWDTQWLQQLTQSILPRHFETIVEIGLNLNQVVEHLSSKTRELQSWAKVFVRASPGVSVPYISVSRTASNVTTGRCRS